MWAVIVMSAPTLLSCLQPDEPVALAQQLIRIPSFLWQESALGHWLADWLGQREFEVELQEVPLAGGASTHQAIGVLRGDGSGPSLMLCGHTDTSDWNGEVFRRAEWRHDPFVADIEDGMLYGLGAINMKAGLAAILMAAETLRRSGPAVARRPDRRLRGGGDRRRRRRAALAGQRPCARTIAS